MSDEMQEKIENDRNAALDYFNDLIEHVPFDCNHAETIRQALLNGVEEVTPDKMSEHIQSWKFNDDYLCSFGEYLAIKYPNGLIVKGEIDVRDR